MDDTDPSPPDHTANLVVESHVLNSLKTSKVIFDSGCSISGTSNVHDLSDVTSSVQGAFGPSTQPAHRGKLDPLGLDAIVIDPRLLVPILSRRRLQQTVCRHLHCHRLPHVRAEDHPPCPPHHLHDGYRGLTRYCPRRYLHPGLIGPTEG